MAKAYDYHARAAAAAQRVYAVEPALAHFTAAIDAANELGLEPDQEPALRRLILQRGHLRYRTGDLSLADVDIRAALDASRRCGDRETEMEALNDLGGTEFLTDVNAGAACHEAAAEIARELGDAGAEANALDRLAVIASHQLRFDRALELGERALALARETGDESGLGRAIDSIKLAVWQLGDLGRLQELTDELEHLWRERGDLWYLQWTVLESAYVPIGKADWEKAAERLARADEINSRTRDPLAGQLIQDALCWLNRSRGAYDDALSAGRRALAFTADRGWHGWAAATLGSTLLDLGAPAAAAEVLERGLSEGERLAAPNETVRCIGLLAWARWMLGDEDEASALTARTVELLGQVSAPEGGAFLFGAAAYTAVARVLVATGEPDRAESLLLPLHGAAERSGWREMEATTGLGLGLCFEARGELNQAHETFASVAETSDRCGLPAPGWEAHSALARVLRVSGSGAEADEQQAVAWEIVERMAAQVSDESLRDRLLARASA
jgi:tetratricopeptide (TPR) repeat protein